MPIVNIDMKKRRRLLLKKVPVVALSVDCLKSALGDRPFRLLTGRLAAVRSEFEGRTLWHVNSTATGGGVAEMLKPLTAYMRGLGVDARWMVISGDSAFFELTKRIHNGIHGVPVQFADSDRQVYERVAAANAKEFVKLVKPGDFVVCHDPQTAGLVPFLRKIGAVVVWRSHIGHDHAQSGAVGQSWAFLDPYLRKADAVVFSRPEYVPGALRDLPSFVIHPSIDPFSVKNGPMDAAHVRAILLGTGLLSGRSNGAAPLFVRPGRDPVRVERPAGILREGDPPPFGTPIVLQVARWDRLKDPLGVMRGFVQHVRVGDTRLVLAGPDVSGVTDDPEGAEVLAEVRSAWSRLPAGARRRVDIVSLPMDDEDENAAIVNALQHYATVVVQKSLCEGFGLTVTEAMWKARPVIASRVGGIQNQITSGVDGLLIDDPRDLGAYGKAVTRVLKNPALARRLGHNAKNRATSRFLVSRHLLQWLELLPSVAKRPVRHHVA